MPDAVDLSDVPAELREAVAAALRAVGVEAGHIAVELVDAERIRELNREHRDRDEPTDVLAFPIDETAPIAGPRELGDVVICPEHTHDLTEAAIHGTLHLCGYDHEVDDGEMLELQGAVIKQMKNPASRCFTTPALPPDGSGREAEQPAVDETLAVPLPVERQPMAVRSGFVGLAGRPNVGKSTLVNAVVGAHVAIVSMRPQTTRRAARGVATNTDEGWQMVLVDLPGVQRPRDVLTERMQRRVERELGDADVVLFVVNGEEGVGAGDRFIADTLVGAGSNTPVICAVNKVDQLSRAKTMKVLAAVAQLKAVDEVFPISARDGQGVDALVKRLTELMPPGPYMYPPGDRTDQPQDVILAELIREQVLIRTRDEIPHSVEVSVLETEEREDGLMWLRAEIWPETESQKGILIGKGGRKIQEIGTAARRRIELELGHRVHLDLQVRTRRNWRRDDGLLDRLGID